MAQDAFPYLNTLRRGEDPLGYAFSADGWLDPGTKLLDIGLTGYTPIAALKTLVDEPLHMSVALHEVTHFVSLENTLGYLLGFLALRTSMLSESLIQCAKESRNVDPRLIEYYHSLRSRYSLLIEVWRPLLEGLAVYVQTHHPDEPPMYLSLRSRFCRHGR